MTFVGEPPRSSNLVQRAMNIILRPSSEWAVIDAEPATVQSLFTGYAMILAAIGPVCALLGGLLFHTPIIVGLLSAVLSYVVNLVGVFVFGLVIDALATSFGAVKDRLRAMKVAVYAATPAWIAGVCNLIPILGALIVLIAALYGIYLLYKGQLIVMRSPQDKAVGYTAVTVVVMIVIGLVLGLIVGAIVGAVAGAALMGMMHAGSVSSTTITTTN